MSFIPEREQQLIRDHFDAHVEGPVAIDFYTRSTPRLVVPGAAPDCEYCDETGALLAEVAALSDRVTLTVHDLAADGAAAEAAGVDRIPTVILRGAAKGTVRYLGIPAGHEFGSLIEDLVDVSRGTTDLAPQTKRALQGLAHDVHIQVFVTPTCPYCPAAARIAHKMAIESPRVTADVIEATEFPDLARRYRVSGVPKSVVNDVGEILGAEPETRFLEEVLRAAA